MFVRFQLLFVAELDGIYRLLHVEYFLSLIYKWLYQLCFISLDSACSDEERVSWAISLQARFSRDLGTLEHIGVRGPRKPCTLLMIQLKPIKNQVSLQSWKFKQVENCFEFWKSISLYFFGGSDDTKNQSQTLRNV